MFEPPAGTSIDPRIADQLRRVRWRRRLREAQRVAYSTIAIGAAGVAVTVLAALRGTERAFVATAVLSAVALGAVALRTGRTAWRRRLPREPAIVWVDRTAGLCGALATLLTARLEGRLAALVVERNASLLPQWTPERVVPAVVPVGPAIAAVLGIVAAATVIRLAPVLLPAIPDVVYVDRSMAPVDAEGLPPGVARLPVGTGGGALPGGDGAAGAVPIAGAAADDGVPPPATAWPAALLDSVRRSLWGRDWDRIRETLARAEQARLHGGRNADARDARAGGTDGLAANDARRDARRRGGTTTPATADDPADGGGIGAGAGDATADALFGEPAGDVHDGADPFALALAARVRTERPGVRPPSGDTPDAEPDARPALAARPRPAEPLRRTAIPPEWHAVVRAVVAHDEAAR